MNFANTLRELRHRANVSQLELSVALGVSRSTIGMYEAGKREPDLEVLEAIADYFNITMDSLVGKKSLPTPTVTEDVVVFPVLGEIAAGYDHIALEEWEGDTVEIPRSYLRGHILADFFVLRIKGDSMYPDYREGDKVLVLKQDTLDYSGQVGAILYDGELATLKRVEFAPGESWLRLVPINPQFPAKRIVAGELEQCRVLGVPRLLLRELES